MLPPSLKQKDIATTDAATAAAAAAKKTAKRANAARTAAAAAAAAATAATATAAEETDDDDDTAVHQHPLVASSVRSHRPPRSEPKDILLDTGANVLCIHKEEYFDSLDKSSVSTADSISVADGSPSAIQGSGTINDQHAKFMPDFSSSLVPASVFADNTVAIFAGDRLHILPADLSTVQAVASIINTAESTNSTLLNIARVNGLYAIDISQLRTLCQTRAFQESHDQAVARVNSSYFTVKLDNLGELVRYWHLAWKHASKRDMVRIVKYKVFDDIPKELTVKVINKHFDDHCMGCKRSTMSQKPLPPSSDRVYEAGECVAIDIKHWEECDLSSHRYSLHALDLGSDYSETYLLTGTSNLIDYIKLVMESYYAAGYLMKEMRVDKQFVTDEIRTFLKRMHVTISQPAPHEHGQNGSIEVLIKHMEEDVNKALVSAHLDKPFWGHAVLDATDIRNLLPSAQHPHVSRAVVWGKSKASLKSQPLIPFGSRVLAHLPLTYQTALSTRSFPAISVGRAPGVKGGIKLYNQATKRVIIRRTFKVMGQVDRLISESSPLDISVSDESGLDELIYDEITDRVYGRVIDPGVQQPGVQQSGVQQSSAEHPIEPAAEHTDDVRYRKVLRSELTVKQRVYFSKVNFQFTDISTNECFKIVDIDFCLNGHNPKTPYYKMYDVQKYPGSPLNEYDYEHMPCAEVLKSRDTRWDDVANNIIIHSMSVAFAYFDQHADVIEKFVNVDREFRVNNVIYGNSTHQANRVDFKEVQRLPPPKNVTQARKHPEAAGYLGSLFKELAAFHKRKCDIPADLPIGDIPPELILQLLPIFSKKYVGTDFSKFKCRIVVLGNKWRNVNGIDNYASMVKIDSIKFLLSLAATEDMDIFALDVEEAFLTTKVNRHRKPRSVMDPPQPDNTYYVRRPPGTYDDELPYISKPEAFIYGHPLANPEFNADLHELLISLDFVPTTYDSNVYVLDNELGKAIIARAVDDMPTFHTGGKAMQEHVMKGIKSKYTVTIDDPIHTIFGIEVHRDRTTRRVRLRQRGSIYNLLNEFLPDWETLPLDSLDSTPMAPRGPLCKRDEALDVIPCTTAEITIYNSKEGSLGWITHTAPDFIVAVRTCARTLKAPTHYNMAQVDRIIRCLARIVRQDRDGLWVGGSEGVQIIATVDSSYHCFADLKSCTGGTIHMSHNSGSIISTCEKQSITADSAMACEGIGAHLHVRRVLPLRYFCMELGFPQTRPSTFYMDNEPFMKTIIGQRGSSERSKHQLIRLRVLEEAWKFDEIDLKHLATLNMVSDILTKPLGPQDWDRLRIPLLGLGPIITNDTTHVEKSQLLSN